jgi:hypothetical protein
MTVFEYFQKNKTLNTLNTLGNNVTKDSVIIFCMREKFYLISDEAHFRMTFKNDDNKTLLIYYNQNNNRYITINEAKIKE